MEPQNDGDKDTAQSATSDTVRVESIVTNTEDKGEDTTKSISEGDNNVASPGKFTYAAALKSASDNSRSSASPVKEGPSDTKAFEEAMTLPNPPEELSDSKEAGTRTEKSSVSPALKGSEGSPSTLPDISVKDLDKEFARFDEKMNTLTVSLTAMRYGGSSGQLYSQTLYLQTSDAIGALSQDAPSAISKVKRQRKSCSTGCPFERLTDAFYIRLSAALDLIQEVSEYATKLSRQALHDRPQSTQVSATNSPEVDKDYIIQKLRDENITLRLELELGTKSTFRDKAESDTQGSSPRGIWEASNISSPRIEPESPTLEPTEVPNIPSPRNKHMSPILESPEAPIQEYEESRALQQTKEDKPKATWTFQGTKRDKPTVEAKGKRTLLPAVDIVPNVSFEAEVSESDSVPEADRDRKPGAGQGDGKNRKPTGREENDTRSYYDRTLPLSSLWDGNIVPSPPRTPVAGERRGRRGPGAPTSWNDSQRTEAGATSSEDFTGDPRSNHGDERQNTLPLHYTYWLRRVEAPQLESPAHRRPHEKDNKHGLYSDGQNAWYCQDEAGWTEIRQFRSPILTSYVLLLHAVSTRMESFGAHTKDYVAFLCSSGLFVKIPMIALCCSLRDFVVWSYCSLRRFLVWSYCSLRHFLVWSYCSLRDSLFWIYRRSRDFLGEAYCRLRDCTVAGSRRISHVGLVAGQKTLTCLRTIALAPFSILGYTSSLIDRMVVIHNMIRVCRIVMFLHTIQVYVAVKREREMWSEANNQSQVHMLRWLSREPTFLMPGIDYSRALGWADITTASMIGLQVLETSLGAGDVAAEYAKGTLASAVASGGELFQTLRKSAWVESASFTTLFFWRLLVYWFIDSVTLPAQFVWFLDAEMNEVEKWVFSCAVGGVGMLLGWLLFIRNNPVATGAFW